MKFSLINVLNCKLCKLFLKVEETTTMWWSKVQQLIHSPLFNTHKAELVITACIPGLSGGWKPVLSVLPEAWEFFLPKFQFPLICKNNCDPHVKTSHQEYVQLFCKLKILLSSMSVGERMHDWGRGECHGQREGEGELDIWGIPFWFWWGLAVGDQLFNS